MQSMYVHLYRALPQARVVHKPSQDSSLLYASDESPIDLLLSEAAALVQFGSRCPYKTDAKSFPTLLQAQTCVIFATKGGFFFAFSVLFSLFIYLFLLCFYVKKK